MTDVPSDKAPRDRSPSFPFVPLQTAVERLIAFEKMFGRHPVPMEKTGSAWGMKEKSSQADQTLAALRSFGLIEYVKVNGRRQASLTEEARKYLRALQDSIKKQVLKQCALRPKVIRKFWTTWGPDRPTDSIAIDHLTFDNNFSDVGAKNFLKVYDATIAFAGLSASDKLDPSTLDEEEDSGEEEEGDRQPPLPPPPPIPPKGEVRLMEGERIVFTEEGQPSQYLKLIASGDVDDFLLEALEDFVKRQRRRIKAQSVSKDEAAN